MNWPMLANVLFWGGLLIGGFGVIADSLIGLILGLITALCGVIIWKENRRP